MTAAQFDAASADKDLPPYNQLYEYFFKEVFMKVSRGKPLSLMPRFVPNCACVGR